MCACTLCACACACVCVCVCTDVILRPITTTIGLITDMYGLYGQGQIDFKKSYVYLVTVTNFSQVCEDTGCDTTLTHTHTHTHADRPLKAADLWLSCMVTRSLSSNNANKCVCVCVCVCAAMGSVLSRSDVLGVSQRARAHTSPV